MFGILANYKNEFSKLFSGKKYVVFMIIEAIICGVVVLTKELAIKLSDGHFNLNQVSTAMTLMGMFVTVVFPFIIFMAACDLFSSEFHDKTVRAVFARPTTRIKVYIGKILAITTLVLMNMIVVLVVSGTLDYIFSGKIVNFVYISLGYFIDIIPLMVLIGMAVLINQFVKSSTMAMFLCIIAYIALNLLGIYYPDFSGLVFTGYMQWHKIIIGTNVPILALFNRAMILLGYGLTFASVSYYMFRYKEC